jgi:hypothetical protein
VLAVGPGFLRQRLRVAAGVPVTRPDGSVTGRRYAGEEGEDFADGRFLAGGLPQWHVDLDLVAVAPPGAQLRDSAVMGVDVGGPTQPIAPYRAISYSAEVSL